MSACLPWFRSSNLISLPAEPFTTLISLPPLLLFNLSPHSWSTASRSRKAWWCSWCNRAGQSLAKVLAGAAAPAHPWQFLGHSHCWGEQSFHCTAAPLDGSFRQRSDPTLVLRELQLQLANKDGHPQPPWGEEVQLSTQGAGHNHTAIGITACTNVSWCAHKGCWGSWGLT